MRTLRRYRQLLLVAAAAVATSVDGGEPRPPEEALESFALHPDLQIELVAAEPQVVDPVAMAFDEQGRLWIAEMSDYPFGPQDGQPPQSRIKLLEDLDHDGRYETAHVFADGLLFATGVQPWRGGVIVTLSGEIAWLADTDGDKRADVHETWFRGFAERNPQLRANDPTLWFDGNVYVAGGLFYGGKIVTTHEPWRAVNGDEPIDLGQRDFRFDPRTGRASAIAGGAQFGLAFDAQGNRFVCSNSRPLEHVVLEEAYLNRSPHLTLTKTNQLVVASGEATPLHPLSRQETTSYLHEGQFTAACGALIYGGDGLPAEFLGNAFICEPTGSLVHRAVLRPAGVSLEARPGREGTEFLASRDSWFRPVFLSEGPDGALYIVDMYRAVIEHPDWFPDLKQRNDLTAGNDRGRIWRVTSRSAGRHHAERGATLGLEHPNVWHRRTAARLIYERAAEADVEAIRHVLKRGSPNGRAAALHVLEGLGELTDDELMAMLDDLDQPVCSAAVRLAAARAKENDKLRLRVAEIARRADADESLAFHSILALGGEPSKELTRVFRDAAASPAVESEWIRAALLCSAHQVPAAEVLQLLTTYAGDDEELRDGQLDLIRQLAEQFGVAATDEETRSVLQGRVVEDHGVQRTNGYEQPSIGRAVLIGLARGMSRRGTSLRDWIANQSPAWQDWWREQLAEAAAAAADLEGPPRDRRQALAVLELAEFAGVSSDLKRLLATSRGSELRTELIRTIGSFDRPEAAEMLLVKTAELSPTERRVAFGVLLGGRTTTEYLLGAIEGGPVDAALVDASARQRLLSHPQEELRKRAESLFGSSSAGIEAVVDAYRPAVERHGVPARGRDVFARHCGACHRVGGIGTAVGPDVADNYNRTREQLLVAILDPNRAIDSIYEAYAVSTVSGRTLLGLLADETAAAVTLQETDGKMVTIPRDEIDELRPTGVSFMPTGLEKEIDVDAMADLLSFLKDWRSLR